MHILPDSANDGNIYSSTGNSPLHQRATPNKGKQTIEKVLIDSFLNRPKIIMISKV